MLGRGQGLEVQQVQPRAGIGAQTLGYEPRYAPGALATSAAAAARGARRRRRRRRVCRRQHLSPAAAAAAAAAGAALATGCERKHPDRVRTRLQSSSYAMIQLGGYPDRDPGPGGRSWSVRVGSRRASD